METTSGFDMRWVPMKVSKRHMGSRGGDGSAPYGEQHTLYTSPCKGEVWRGGFETRPTHLAPARAFANALVRHTLVRDVCQSRPGGPHHVADLSPSRACNNIGLCHGRACGRTAHPAQGPVSYAIAKTIAENAIADCKTRGYAVSVVVVDRGGDTMVAMRADDAGPHTMENARRKAYTARTFRMTTEEFVKEMATRPVRREQTTLPNVIAIPGGVPIKVGKRRDRRRRPLRLARHRRALRDGGARQGQGSAAVGGPNFRKPGRRQP